MAEVCPDKENPYDSSAVDRAIHIWSNRGSKFVGDVYAEDFKFERHKNIDTQLQLLRSLLMLDREETTWYLGVAQNIISCFPGIERYLKGNIFSKSSHELVLKKTPILNGVSIVNDGNRYSAFTTNYNTFFPIPKTYTIDWSSEDFVSINNGEGKVSYVAVKVTSTYGEPKQFLGYSLIRGDWGDAMPFKGTLRYDGLWSLGSQATVDYFPPTIDYKVWVSEIEKSVDVSNLITRTGLYENYSLAKEPLEKLALLYASIYIDYDQQLVTK